MQDLMESHRNPETGTHEQSAVCVGAGHCAVLEG